MTAALALFVLVSGLQLALHRRRMRRIEAGVARLEALLRHQLLTVAPTGADKWAAKDALDAARLAR